MIQILSCSISTIFGVCLPACCNLTFVTIADRQQHVLCKVEIPTLFTVVLKNMGFDDGVHWAAFFAETTENTLCQINVIPRGTTRPICPNIRLNRDRHRRTNCFAQLTSDAPLFTVFVPAQSMQPTESRRLWCFFFGYSSVILLLKAYLPVSAIPLNNSTKRKLERKSFNENSLTAGVLAVGVVGIGIGISNYFQMFQGVCIHTPMNTNQTNVTGMNIFQPKRMIWS